MADSRVTVQLVYVSGQLDFQQAISELLSLHPHTKPSNENELVLHENGPVVQGKDICI